jgi:hypothetical protein
MSVPHRPREDPDNDHGGPKRWVIIAGILAVAALLGLMVFLHLTGVIGPGRH